MTLARWFGILGGVLLVLGGTPVVAQSSADALFHDAAQQYVAGDTEAARQAVEKGLLVAPSDPRLQALRKKLKQQEKQRGGGRSSGQESQNRQQDQQSGEEGAQEKEADKSGEKRRAQADAPSGQQSPRQSDPQQSARSEQAGQNAQGGGARQRQGAERQQVDALSRAQAERLLQALENQEKKLLREVRTQAQKSTTVEKDW